MMDGIDLNNVEIHNSHDVRQWPATARITRLQFNADGVHVEHTKNVGPGAWPNFRPAGWDGDLQYTLWIFLKINGRWHGSGCIQYWQACEKNGGPPEEFAANWYYAADRWGPMTGYQPQPGERVGFMVSAGDARNSGTQSVPERSQIVGMPFPSSGADVYPVPDVVEPVQPVEPPPGPSPTPGPEVPADAILAALSELARLNLLQTQAIAELKASVDEGRQNLKDSAKLISAAIKQRITR